MADANPDTPIDETEEPVKKGGGLMGLVKAVAFISVVVLVEVVAASVLIPSGYDAEQTAKQLAAAENGELANEGEDSTDDTSGEPDKDTMEVDLGRYNVTRYNPETDKTLIIDFELFGVVLAEEEVDFGTKYEANKVRLREQVIMTLGAAESIDLADANLGLLKRRILEKSNRALGQPFVREVLFSKFNFAER